MNPAVALSVEGLTISTRSNGRVQRLVGPLSFDVQRGSICALIGCSGTGKSLTGAAIQGLAPPGIEFSKEAISITHTDEQRLSKKYKVAPRLGRTGVFTIFQSPGSVLNPTMRCGPQVGEAIVLHNGGNNTDIQHRIEILLNRVGLDTSVCNKLPGELSGGMRQRLLIAMAIALEPALLVADEPTTGLDVVTERRIVELLVAQVRRLGSSMLFITHDLRLVSRICDRVLVMDEGEIVENRPTSEFMGSPIHAASRQLVESYSRFTQKE